MPYFTTQFRALCQLRKATASAVAIESGVDQSSLSRILHGERQMTLDGISRIVSHCEKFTESDKLALIRAWLIDNTPEEFRDRVLINVQPALTLKDGTTDNLTAALQFLEKSCSDPTFAEWLIHFHKLLTAATKKKK